MMCFVKSFFGARSISKSNKKWIVAALVLCGCAAAQNASPPSQSAESSKPANMVLGLCSWEDWQKEAKWDDYEAADYVPDSLAVRKIAAKAQSPDITFLLFGGSWCGDSRDGMPKIFKVLRAAGIAPERTAVYGVDRKKREETGTAEKFQVKRVPTLIVLKAGQEIGRIVETPTISWERDLAALLEKSE
ncbi:MAG: thioredoxin family protein [Chloroherpetonaceae bacterium]|nr:thioredoxin family protein [Chloroherpetonaceae bacterium]